MFEKKGEKIYLRQKLSNIANQIDPINIVLQRTI